MTQGPFGCEGLSVLSKSRQKNCEIFLHQNAGIIDRVALYSGRTGYSAGPALRAQQNLQGV